MFEWCLRNKLIACLCLFPESLCKWKGRRQAIAHWLYTVEVSCDFHDNARLHSVYKWHVITCMTRDVMVGNKKIYVSRRLTFFPSSRGGAYLRNISRSRTPSRTHSLIDVSIPANLSSVTFTFGRRGYCIPFHVEESTTSSNTDGMLDETPSRAPAFSRTSRVTPRNRCLPVPIPRSTYGL